ncbi:MAG: ABC transporter ATP-binding protein [Deltaproteobacteria bacterium]|nr:MAG: ABC transporter ATP-binding protein [Deltaproteobacteria bacterium]
MPLLQLKDIHCYYGNIHALKGVSLEVYSGEIRTLIGANGAGKSTTLMAISAIMRPKKGEVFYQGASLSGRAPDEIVKAGLCQVPEGRRIFPGLTIKENLEMGAYCRRGKSAINADLEMVYDLFPVLGERRKQAGGTLSGGEQQMLAIGRALMSKPQMLLLDEPSLGLAPLMVEKIFSIIERIAGEGITILLVEQNAHAALNLADYGYVMETGKIILEAPARELLQDERVKEAYLGE